LTAVDTFGWEEAYVQYGEGLVRFAAALVGSDNAEDLVASTFLGLLRSRPRLIEHTSAYLYQCVLNAAQKHHRAEFRRSRRELTSTTAISYEAHDVDSDVVNALRSLSPQQRAIVYLSYWEDLSASAVAARLGLSSGTVHKQLARSRQRLREALG
jgi:RNA polymerase sigma-70 factor (ECF subfamily)